MKKLIKSLTVVTTLTLVGSTHLQSATFDDFNDGNDTTPYWVHYGYKASSISMVGSLYDGSWANRLECDAGSSPATAPWVENLLAVPPQADFYVSADLVNWQSDKTVTRFLFGVLGRFSAPPLATEAGNGYMLMLRQSTDGVRHFKIIEITDGNMGELISGDFTMAGTPLPLPAAGKAYKLIFTGTGSTLTGQIINSSTGLPMDMWVATQGVITNRLVAVSSTYASGYYGFGALPLNLTVQDVTFDNFYLGTAAPDPTPPTITCPANVTLSANAGLCYATGVALGTPVASDNSGTVTVTNNAPAQFNKGVTTVTWTAFDPSGNTVTCAQTVTVNDTEPPVGSCPADVTVSTDFGQCYATDVALGTGAASDNCGIQAVWNNAPAQFNKGVTPVTWWAQDTSGNTISCAQSVTVNDTELPTITCPANVTVSANAGVCYATGVTLGTPATSDNCGIQAVWNNAPAQFNKGVTPVTWWAQDTSGNLATCSQTVTVLGGSAGCYAIAGCTAIDVILDNPATADNCSVASVTHNAPAVYPLGTNVVTWTVTDGSGNTATTTQEVVVQDLTAPTISCPADVTVTANAGNTAINVILGSPATADNCSVASVTSNAPAAYPLGPTVVTWTVTDGSGNTATCVQTVTVNAIAPVANPDSVARTPGLSLKILKADLLANDTSETVTNFVGVSATSTNGVTLTTDATWIFYTNSPNVNDQFTYTITDGSDTATGVVRIIMTPLAGGQATTVDVVGSTATVGFAGIPGFGYEVQRATTLVSPTWVTVLTTNAPPAGVFQAVDDFSDLGSPPAAAYYRLRWIP